MKYRVLAIAAATALGLTACSSAPPAADSSAKAGGPKVAVAFYPIEYATAKVGGDKVSVTNLTTPGSEPHDLELTPSQIAILEEADLVVYLKGFQPAVDKAIEASSAKHKLDLATVISLHPAAEEHHDEAEEGEKHAEDEKHAEGEKGEHDHGTTDPHYWLDPTLMAKSAEAIAASLGEADAANKDTYAANAKTAGEEFTALDDEFKTGLGNCKIKAIVTTHAAFGYLTDRYGLKQVGISGLSPNEQPSPERITEVQDEAKEHGVSTIFFETLTSPDVAKSIAGDLGLKTAVLDPIEGITKDSSGTDYPSVMRTNLKTLQEANACS